MQFTTLLIFPFIFACIISLVHTSYAAQGNQTAFYSPDFSPPGKSIQTLIGDWWNWWISLSYEESSNWPKCLTGNSTISANESVTFLGDPARGVESNANSTKQECVISSNQPIFIPLYTGECDTGMEGESSSSHNVLKKCAEDSNAYTDTIIFIDGTEVTNHNFVLYTDEFFDIKIPESNAFLTQSGTFKAAAGGIYAFLKSLPSGDHEIAYEYKRPQESGKVTYFFHVLPSSK